jgi:RNA polymerase sigma-70 factor (ECF subfamily)
MAALRFDRPKSAGTPGEGDDGHTSDAARSLRDAELVDAIRTGNQACADAFCRRVWPQVDRTVRRLVGRDDSEREDLMQVAIIELVKAIASYRGDCALDTWVAAVTAHVVYRQLRRRRRLYRNVSLDAVDAEALVSTRLDSEGVLVAREVLSRILGHLDSIGEKLAWIFILHDVLGYGLRDAANIVDISEAAAQSRLVRGRRRLHERIADDPELADLLTALERKRDKD